MNNTKYECVKNYLFPKLSRKKEVNKYENSSEKHHKNNHNCIVTVSVPMMILWSTKVIKYNNKLKTAKNVERVRKQKRHVTKIQF